MAHSLIKEQDRAQIAEVIHRYFWLVDHGRAQEIPSLFAEDGTLVFGEGSPEPGTLTRADISAAMSARAQQTYVTTRHVVTNLTLNQRDKQCIQAYCLLTLFRSDDGSRDTHPRSVADIVDRFVLVNTTWLIAHREISPIFNRA